MAVAASALTATLSIVNVTPPVGVTIGTCCEIGSGTTGGPEVPAAPEWMWPATMTDPESRGDGSTPALIRFPIENEKLAVYAPPLDGTIVIDTPPVAPASSAPAGLPCCPAGGTSAAPESCDTSVTFPGVGATGLSFSSQPAANSARATAAGAKRFIAGTPPRLDGIWHSTMQRLDSHSGRPGLPPGRRPQGVHVIQREVVLREVQPERARVGQRHRAVEA